MSEIPGQSGHALPVLQPPACANKGSHYSIEPFQLLLGALEVRCAEPFGEPFINWNEKIACFSLLMLISPEPGETHGRA
jgi:hypothetical protein